ncbi:MAG: hypothetical protein KBG15_06495 [Kofleriaceae bacterium]|nr:hypothetical protein [Kofleriaceae bacterium]
MKVHASRHGHGALRTSVVGTVVMAAVVVGGSANAEPVRARPLFDAGIAMPVRTYTLYGAGLRLRGGMEVAFCEPSRHRLIVDGQWIGLAINGARVDVGVVGAWWRMYLGPRFHVDVGTGLVAALQRQELVLPERSVDDQALRAGTQLAASLGLSLGHGLEVELGYQQILYFQVSPRTAGFGHASIGLNL